MLQISSSDQQGVTPRVAKKEQLYRSLEKDKHDPISHLNSVKSWVYASFYANFGPI